MNVTNSSRVEIHDLRMELSVAQSMLKAEKAARLERTRIGAENGDDDDDDRDLDDTLLVAKELAQTAAELQTAHEELEYFRNLAAESVRAKQEETRAAQDAATVAVKASLRRSELEMENEELLSELIEIKMRQANMAIDLDSERRRGAATKKRLQNYAAQVASLEVAVSDAYASLAASDAKI